jgi:outer membrane cobalamin receptor
VRPIQDFLIRTLLLVDGFKLDDVQTGHHSMNSLPVEVIKRIEIIKAQQVVSLVKMLLQAL